MVLDLAYAVGRTYMLSLVDMAEGAPSALMYGREHLLCIAGILLLLTAVCALSVTLAADSFDIAGRRRTSGVLVAVSVAGFSVDYSRGEIALFHDDSQTGQRMVRNSLHRLLVDIRNVREDELAHRGVTERFAGASVQLMEVADHGEIPGNTMLPDIVFVLVESWGRAESEQLASALTAPYRSKAIKGMYQVSMGTTAFHGATVAGELRELCGTTLGLGVIAAPAAGLKDCLPERLQKSGYHTVAVHGFDGAMFERISWYPKMGFEETWFRRDFKERGLPECPGPLPGICDAAIAGWLGDRLEEARAPQFIYWVTLNSHLPVPLTNGVVDPASCSGIAMLSDEALCAWYQLVENVHRSVADLAVRRTKRPSIFVIVGDHAPPFASEARREQFSSSVVPYVMLIPKSEGEVTPPPRKPVVVAARSMHDHGTAQQLPEPDEESTGHLHGHGN
jgi:hypothetical protein